MNTDEGRGFSRESGFTYARSPFKPPNDEEVFVTRETEKQKKKEAKEQSKRLKIWDKNTSTTRAPLRKVRDRDISPAENDEAVPNYNPSQRGFISTAMTIAHSRVQFPRETRGEAMCEFIDQKKEMFLASMANQNVKDEITQLKEKQEKRKCALEASKQELE